MAPDATDWEALAALVDRLAEPGVGPSGVAAEEWQPLAQALDSFVAAQNWAEIVHLRLLLVPLFGRDSVTGLPLLRRIDDCALEAAGRLGRHADLGHFWGARGHNLHRQGFHKDALAAFQSSVRHYTEAGEPEPALRSYYMQALCRRALGDAAGALEIVETVLAQTPQEDAWRGNPLQVRAWLQRDAGDLAGAEISLKNALALQAATADPDILVAGTLADLGEVISLQRRGAEAVACFEDSLAGIRRHRGQYNRQEARTLLKYAEHLLRDRRLDEAKSLLDAADDLIRAHGEYYDLMWRLEAAYSRIYLQRGQFAPALSKLRSTLRYRRLLQLPMRHRLRLLRKRLGLP
jgi:tetratricopeptide (TPR) repeat protein